jgi:RNA polymerase sigma-70 factor (ECF subfamily)
MVSSSLELRVDQSTPASQSPELHVLGTPAGWEEVYREHVGPVYRYVYARTGNRPDAEDITAQAFLRALPRLRLRASTPEIRSYLMATARSVLAEHWTLHYGVDVGLLDEALAAPPEEPPQRSSEDAGVSRAARVLSALPEHYRRILELRFLRGYSVRETAREMNITVTNAKVLQHRALRRAALEDLS